MASPLQDQLATPLSSSRVRSPASRVLEAAITPGSRNGRRSPLSDEAIWMRLREAGFDEESIKRRDKSALIAYIAKLETEIFDYQHHMGLLILEKKDWTSKYEQVKASADSAELAHKLDQAAHLSALAEARKREESLKKALAIEKECIANIEKTLHEMRAESAEAKIAAEGKMIEACTMLENAKKKFIEAEAKMNTAESMEAEAARSHRTAQRKLDEVKEREDELRRRLITFKTECDAKEKEISLERQSLCERQKVVQQEQEKLLDGQELLNKREEYVNGRYQELSRVEKELEASKAEIEQNFKSLNQEKLNLEQELAALSTREKAVDQKEALLDKRDQELLSLQEKLAHKEYDEIQRLLVKNEAVLEMRKSELETEIEQRHRSMEDEMENKRRVCELRDVDLRQREELIQEREQELEVQFRALMEEKKDATERLNTLQEREANLSAAEEAKELEKIYLQKEKEEIKSMKLDLQNSITTLENKRKEVEEAQEKLEASKCERNELLVLEMKLKDEIDNLRSQKHNLMAEAEELKAEKSKFETEWELIDEKRDELRREAERIFEERKEVSKFLKVERDRLKIEKETLHDQFKCDVESLSQEREAFVSKMEQEHSEWFSKIQQERANLVQDVELQKRELENCILKRRDEIESYLREKEEAFEQEKAKELLYISSQKEMVTKEWENVESEMKRLDNERSMIRLDRERREKEMAELKKSIEELQTQKEKLREQRELLHGDREKISVQMQDLDNLENLKVASENIVLSEMIEADLKYYTRKNLDPKRLVNLQNISKDVDLDSCTPKEATNEYSNQVKDNASAPSPARFSWMKKCTEFIFKHSPEQSSSNLSVGSPGGANLLQDKFSQNDKKDLLVHLKKLQDTSRVVEQQMLEGKDEAKSNFGRIQPVKFVNEESIVVLEVPSVDDNPDGSCHLNSETKTEIPDNSTHLYPEDETISGRKRVHPFSSDKSDAPRQQKRDKKQRRQGTTVLEVPFEEEITSNSAVSTPNEDENGTGKIEQTGGSANGNHETLEDATENKGTESFTEAQLVFAENSLSVSDQNDDKVKRSDGYAYSCKVGNGLRSRGVKGQKNTRSARTGSDLSM